MMFHTVSCGKLDEWRVEIFSQRTDWYTLNFSMRILYRNVLEREHAVKGHNNPLDLDGESVMLVAYGPLRVTHHGICQE